MNKPSKIHPIRPAPPPPINGWNKNTSDSTEYTEHDSSFDLPPPSMPAPELEIGCDNEKDNFSTIPPVPPPRVDSFQDNSEEEPPLSPWHNLPPAPPLPPLTDETLHNEDPPPIPIRPTILESQEFNVQINPPPIPARTTRPPMIPPRRSVQ